MNPAFSPLRAASTKIRPLTGIFSLIVPLVAFAELPDDSLLGVGLRARPAYDGSASEHLQPVPIVRYFGQPWFVRSTQGVLEGGVRTKLAPGLHIGAQLAYEPGRKMSESDFLKSHNVADIDYGASIGMHLEWDNMLGPVPVTLLARARQRTDADLGAQADLRLSAGAYRSGPLAVGLFTQVTWANAKSASAFYSNAPQQSAPPGLPAFHARVGWLFASVGALWSVDLSRDWVLVGSVESRRLHGSAAHSPLVERGLNYYASAGLAYRF